MLGLKLQQESLVAPVVQLPGSRGDGESGRGEDGEGNDKIKRRNLIYINCDESWKKLDKNEANTESGELRRTMYINDRCMEGGRRQGWGQAAGGQLAARASVAL